MREAFSLMRENFVKLYPEGKTKSITNLPTKSKREETTSEQDYLVV